MQSFAKKDSRFKIREIALKKNLQKRKKKIKKRDLKNDSTIR